MNEQYSPINPVYSAAIKAIQDSEPIREFFERIAFFIVTGVVAYGAVLAFGKAGLFLFPVVSHYTTAYILCLLALFVTLLVGLNVWLVGGKGGSRRGRLRKAITTCAFPIILGAGFWGGYEYCEYERPMTEQGRLEKAALSACMELPVCIRQAQAYAN